MHSDDTPDRYRSLLFDYADGLLDSATRRAVDERLEKDEELAADLAAIMDLRHQAEVWHPVAVPHWQPPTMQRHNLALDALRDWFPTVASAVALVETDRARDFSPVKNAEGSDSPETARRDLTAQYRAWLEAAGVAAPPDVNLEIDHSRIDSAEDACALGLRDLSHAEDAQILRAGARA